MVWDCTWINLNYWYTMIVTRYVFDGLRVIKKNDIFWIIKNDGLVSSVHHTSNFFIEPLEYVFLTKTSAIPANTSMVRKHIIFAKKLLIFSLRINFIVAPKTNDSRAWPTLAVYRKHIFYLFFIIFIQSVHNGWIKQLYCQGFAITFYNLS